MAIEVTQDLLHRLFRYDDETGHLIWMDRLHGRSRPHLGQPAGCIRSPGYRDIKIGAKAYKAHRLVWMYHHGGWPEGEIDHINRDKADNRIENLRLATRSQNSVNKAAVSGWKGVHKAYTSRRSGRQSYKAAIKVGDKQRFIGYFDCPAAASLAYQVESHKVFGEFASAG